MDLTDTWLFVATFFQANVGSRTSYESPTRSTKVKIKRDITVESLHLEPLCNEVITFHLFFFNLFFYSFCWINLIKMQD